MTSYVWGAAVRPLLAGMVAFAAPSFSPTALAVETGNSLGTQTPLVLTAQDAAPVQQYDLYLPGFQVARERPAVQGAAHYFAHPLLLSSPRGPRLTTAAQRLWRPHGYEGQSGLVIAPGLPQKGDPQRREKRGATSGQTWSLRQGKEQSLPVGYASALPVGTASRMQGPTTDGQLSSALVEERDRRCKVAVNDLRRQRAARAPTHAVAQPEQRLARADPPVPTPEPQPPAPSTPRSDTPQAVDPEPEPRSNVPAPEGPPATPQPLPAEPELPPPPTPEPAEPGLPPPPMPTPAEPPPLSQQPELNPPGPAEPEPRPPAPRPEAEPPFSDKTSEPLS